MLLPDAYRDFMVRHEPFEGDTAGRAGYIAMWPLAEVDPANADFEVPARAPGFTAFASDGGGELLAFDARGQVWLLPMVGLAADQARFVAASFEELAGTFTRP